MNLVDKRIVYTQDLALLLQYGRALGFRILLDETMRSRDQAKWNATHCRVVNPKTGKRCGENVTFHSKAYALSGGRRIRHEFKPIGIAKSVHCSGLGADLYVIEDGKISNDREKYAKLGAFWKSLRDGNCWGGDFKGFADLGHFSREHRGRR